jgi:hypothetical protein
MSLVKHLELPREHGAWGMLTVAVGAGLFTAGQPGEGSAWLVLAALLAFSSRESLVQTLRAWRRGRAAGRSGRLALVKLVLLALTGGVLSSPRVVGLAGARSGRRCSGRAAPQACTGGT